MENNIVSFRSATADDVELVISFVKKLAVAVDMEDEVDIDVAKFKEWMFDKRKVEALFILENGKEVGMALYLYLFATFNCRQTLYLEDLYIDQEYRSKGYGRLVFKQLAQIAKKQDINRIEWTCKTFNDKGLSFYKSLGATKLDKRVILRLEKDNLNTFLEELI